MTDGLTYAIIEEPVEDFCADKLGDSLRTASALLPPDFPVVE